jgi:hypothetical protein
MRNIPDNATNPDWENKTRVHDWRNYASQQLQDMWPSLHPPQMEIIAETLQDIADNEEWD